MITDSYDNVKMNESADDSRAKLRLLIEHINLRVFFRAGRKKLNRLCCYCCSNIDQLALKNIKAVWTKAKQKSRPSIIEDQLNFSGGGSTIGKNDEFEEEGPLSHMGYIYIVEDYKNKNHYEREKWSGKMNLIMKETRAIKEMFQDFHIRLKGIEKNTDIEVLIKTLECRSQGIPHDKIEGQLN